MTAEIIDIKPVLQFEAQLTAAIAGLDFKQKQKTSEVYMLVAKQTIVPANSPQLKKAVKRSLKLRGICTIHKDGRTWFQLVSETGVAADERYTTVRRARHLEKMRRAKKLRYRCTDCKRHMDELGHPVEETK